MEFNQREPYFTKETFMNAVALEFEADDGWNRTSTWILLNDKPSVESRKCIEILCVGFVERYEAADTTMCFTSLLDHTSRKCSWLVA